MSLSSFALPIVRQQLTSLSAILDKAEAFATTKKVAPATMLGLRLTPDMLPLSAQVFIACDSVKNGAARLAGLEAPAFADDATDLPALKDRIARTLAYLDTVPVEAFDAGASRQVVFPTGPQTKATMRGDQYLAHIMLPNFMFHVTTAYALLRHGGVELGKRDFLGNPPGATPV